MYPKIIMKVLGPRLISGLVVGLGASILLGVVHAAPTGSSPMGKPFVEIAGQIVEVQNDLTSLETAHLELVARVESMNLDLQGQINALNADITLLKAKDGELFNLLNFAIATLESQGTSISLLFQSLSNVNKDIVNLSNAAGDNSLAIAALEATQQNILSDIAMIDANLLTQISQISENQALIELLQFDIADLEAKKQNDVKGSCPTGALVTTVLDDGTLQCGGSISGTQVDVWTIEYEDSLNMDNTVDFSSFHCHFSFNPISLPVSNDGSAFDTVEQFITYYTCIDRHWHNEVNVKTRKVARVTCPNGTYPTGGGYRLPESGNVIALASRPFSFLGWEVILLNTSDAPTNGEFASVYARCLDVIR